MAATEANKFKLALVQLSVGGDKAANLQRAVKLVCEAAGNGANIIALPECFNSPYGTSYFPAYCEPIPGESTECLSRVAKETKTYIIGGSIPEKDGDKIYNTCTVFNTAGDMIAKYRKMHLFDVDIPGKIKFQESEILSPGNELVTFDTEYCKVDLGICHDMKFAKLAALYRQKGYDLLVYPGAFEMTTGPAHWETLIIARSLDNQTYTAAVCGARDDTASYVAYGHSTVANPWGEVIAKAGHEEEIIYATIDLDYVREVRQQIPISQQKRNDLYCLSER